MPLKVEPSPPQTRTIEGFERERRAQREGQDKIPCRAVIYSVSRCHRTLQTDSYSFSRPLLVFQCPPFSPCCWSRPPLWSSPALLSPAFLVPRPERAVCSYYVTTAGTIFRESSRSLSAWAVLSVLAAPPVVQGTPCTHEHHSCTRSRPPSILQACQRLYTGRAGKTTA